MPEEKEPYLPNSNNNISSNYQELTLQHDGINSVLKKNMPLSNQLDENQVPTCHTAFPVDLKEVFELTNPSEEVHQTILRPSNEINTIQYTQVIHSPKSSQHDESQREHVSWSHVLREHTADMSNRPPSQVHHEHGQWETVIEKPQDLSESDPEMQGAWNHVINKHGSDMDEDKQMMIDDSKDQPQISRSWNHVLDDHAHSQMLHESSQVLNGHKSWNHVMDDQSDHQDMVAPPINLSGDCTKLSPLIPERRDASCQVDDIPNDLHHEEHQKSMKSKNCRKNASSLEDAPQSLLDLTIASDVPSSSTQVVVHNGIRPELYTQERHLVVEAGTKAQIATKTNGVYPCNHCNKEFADTRSLQRHILIHVGLRPYRCPVCGKAFMLNGDLTRHIRIHSGERPYACEICGRRFTLKGNLMQHFRTHTPEKQYACTICEKNYAQKDSLHRHIRAHFGEKPFECTTCGKRFTLKGDLSRHILIHSGVKPHTCKFCGRQFALKGNLTQHVRTHVRTQGKGNNINSPPTSFVKSQSKQLVIRDLSYSHLEKSYSSTPNSASALKLLPLDQNSTHPYLQSSPSETNHQSPSSGLSFCSECSKTFPSPESLHDHVQLIHEQSTRLASNRYLCNICQKEFCLKGDLTRHLNSHNGVKPYECEHCNKTFTLKSNLRQHLTTHRLDKSFACPMCSKSFGNRRNLNLHLRRHEQARANFTCTKCGRSFLAKSDHFFHDCLKNEDSPSENQQSVNTAINGNSSPQTSSQDSMNSNVISIQANPDDNIQTSTTLTPVKRESCHLPCDDGGITEPVENVPPGISPVNGTQSFLGPFYRHLYFSTSHQTMLPTLKGLLHATSGDANLADYTRVGKSS